MLKYRIGSRRIGQNGVEVQMHFSSQVQAREAGKTEAKLGFKAKLWMIQEAMIEEFVPEDLPVPLPGKEAVKGLKVGENG